VTLSRRALIVAGVAAGGGLGLWYASRRLDDGDASAKFVASSPDSRALNAFIKIAPDGRVICAVHRAEMGQGVTTALPMLLAEELDADWSRVSYEFAPVDRDYFNFGIMERGRPLGPIEDSSGAAIGTALFRELFHAIGMSMTISSASVIDAWDSLRPAGAAARQMLVEAAAARWNTPAGELVTEPGVVVNPVSGARLEYGELADDAARISPPSDPPLKNPADWRLAGRPLPRLDVPTKVTGSARFALDTRLPGLRYAAIVHSPVAGGQVGDWDAGDARAMPGVERVVPAGRHALAVIAGNSWQARQGAMRLRLENTGATGAEGVDSTGLFAAYRRELERDEPPVFREDGDALGVLACRTPIEAEYRLPYLAHVCMEPMNCTALVEADRVEVWAPTQANSIARDVAAATTGVDPSQVTVHTTLMGGGFGRRAEMDFVEQAVAAAMAVPGTPVQASWAREQDVRHDMYRPAALARLRAALDASGKVSALDYRLVTQSVVASYFARTPTPRGGDAEGDGSMASGASNLVYAIPNLRVSAIPVENGVPVGYWRSTGTSVNGFIVEAFMDELAEVAGADPLEFRLRHLDPAGPQRRVLERLAELVDWQPGGGRGLALTESHGSICGQVVEIDVSNDRLKILRVSCVLDCRRIVHPDIVRSQVESAILDGLAAALYGEITLASGRVQQGNFDRYRLPRLADTPQLEIVLMESGGRPGGVGEPAVPAVAPALVNALRSSGTGNVYELPLSRSRPALL